MFRKKKLSQVQATTDAIKKTFDSFTDTLLSRVSREFKEQAQDVLNAEDTLDYLRKELESTSEQKRKAEDDLAKARSKARVEETEWKALLQLRQDKMDVELEKRELAIEREHLSKEMDLLKSNHGAQLEAIEKQGQRLDEFMEKVMDKLTYIRQFEGPGPDDVKIDHYGK
jgi:chromosome segregation ATPase